MQDTRNVTDEFKGQPHDEIVAALDVRGVELEIAIENLERDFNMGTIVRTANALGIRRVLPVWQPGKLPEYPRGIGPTLLGKPVWKSAVKSKADAEQKRCCQEKIRAIQETSDALLSELKDKLRAVDKRHNTALSVQVRELFDYPVFVAAPKTVGITSTGETGENVPTELPAVLNAHREFERWAESGAKLEELPNFPLPSAA